MDPETARRYTEAAAALTVLADFGLSVRDQIRAEMAAAAGGPVPEHQVVIEAAQRFTRRRTG